MNPEVPLPTPGSLGLLKKHVPSPTLAKDPASVVWPSSNIGSLTRSLSVWVSACACRKRLWAPWWSPAAPLSSGLSSACGCRFKSPLRCELRADKAGLLPVMEAAGRNLTCRRYLQKQKSPVQTGQGGRRPTPRSRGPPWTRTPAPSQAVTCAS